MTDNFDFLLEKKAGENTFFFPFTFTKVSQEHVRYYTVELIRRNKDFPEGTEEGPYHFKTYHIYSREGLRKSEDEIKKLCDMFNLRAYISTNSKDPEQVTKNALAELATRVAKGSYRDSWNVFDSCDSKYSDNRKIIIDIDDVTYCMENIIPYVNIINRCPNKDRLKKRCKLDIQSPKKFITYTGNDEDEVYDNVICAMPSKSGIHIIAYGFDKNMFFKECKENGLNVPEWKDNGITVLYENIKKQ